MALLPCNLQAVPFLGKPFLQAHSHMSVNEPRPDVSVARLVTGKCICLFVPLNQSLNSSVYAPITMHPRSLGGELCESTKRTSDVEGETRWWMVDEMVVVYKRHGQGSVTLSKGK